MKRYELQACGEFAKMRESSKGYYVRHEDVLHLIEERNRLREGLLFYGDPKNWNSVTDGYRQFCFLRSDDFEYSQDQIKIGGLFARQALQKVEK